MRSRHRARCGRSPATRRRPARTGSPPIAESGRPCPARSAPPIAVQVVRCRPIPPSILGWRADARTEAPLTILATVPYRVRSCLGPRTALLPRPKRSPPAPCSWPPRPAAACTGDCDGTGSVTDRRGHRGGEHRARRVGADALPADRSRPLGMVEIDELLDGRQRRARRLPCRGDRSPSRTPARPTRRRPTRRPRRRPSATLRRRRRPRRRTNRRVLPTASIYRTYPGFPIRVALDATDPEGGAVHCAVDNLPPGAAFDDQTGVLSWTPADDQLGPFYLPYRVPTTPHRRPRRRTAHVQDVAARRLHDPDRAIRPRAAPPPGARRASPAAPAPRRHASPSRWPDCPEGRVLYVGQNANIDTLRSAAELRRHGGHEHAAVGRRGALPHRDALHEHARPGAAARSHGQHRGEPSACCSISSNCRFGSPSMTTGSPATATCASRSSASGRSSTCRTRMPTSPSR